MATDPREERLRTALQETLRRLGAGRDELDLVEDLPILDAFVEDYADARIADARAAGASWTDIARRLGVSRQAVHKRFANRSGRRGTRIELRLTRDRD